MLNKSIQMGRLTADPELRRTPNNTAVTSFSLAVERDMPNKQTGEREADFIDYVCFGGTAEFVSKWFSKGSMVAVVGRIQTRTWEDKQGNKRKSVEVVADNVYFAGNKKTEQSDMRSFDFAGVDVTDESDLPF